MNNNTSIPAVVCTRDFANDDLPYGATGRVEPKRTRLDFWKFWPDGSNQHFLLADRELFFPGAYPAQASEPKPPYRRSDLEQKLKREVSAMIEKDIIRVLYGTDASAPDTGEKARVAELRRRLTRARRIACGSSGPKRFFWNGHARAYFSALNIVDEIFGPENNNDTP